MSHNETQPHPRMHRIPEEEADAIYASEVWQSLDGDDVLLCQTFLDTCVCELDYYFFLVDGLMGDGYARAELQTEEGWGRLMDAINAKRGSDADPTYEQILRMLWQVELPNPTGEGGEGEEIDLADIV